MAQLDLFSSPPQLPVTKPEDSPTKTFSFTDEKIDFKQLQDSVSQCRLCKLAQTRTQTVFGEGDSQTELLFIGEGPGRQEDLSGRPFIGPAGQLLTRMIEQGMQVDRSRVYITNIVKCRPTVDLAFAKDRPPEADEVEACTPHLFKQIQYIQPKVIVAVGGPAAKFLLNTKLGITKLHGQWADFHGIPVMPIYHPSYILRNGGDSSPLKKELWADIQLVMAKLGWERKS